MLKVIRNRANNLWDSRASEPTKEKLRTTLKTVAISAVAFSLLVLSINNYKHVDFMNDNNFGSYFVTWPMSSFKSIKNIYDLGWSAANAKIKRRGYMGAYFYTEYNSWHSLFIHKVIWLITPDSVAGPCLAKNF